MAHPNLGFCPYLPLSTIVTFADWEIGPVEAFDGRWSDERFESQAEAFLAKFVDGAGSSIKNPSILCRQGRPIDGTLPSTQEIDALEHAIPFGFLDQNPGTVQRPRVKDGPSQPPTTPTCTSGPST